MFRGFLKLYLGNLRALQSGRELFCSKYNLIHSYTRTIILGDGFKFQDLICNYTTAIIFSDGFKVQDLKFIILMSVARYNSRYVLVD